MSATIKLRRDTATNWAGTNPTLAAGEPGWDTTNKTLKIGDGSTAWGSLAAANGGSPSPAVLISGLWYPPYNTFSFTADVTVKNTMYLVPYVPSATHTFVKLGTNVSTAGTGSVLRFGIYADNGSGAPAGVPLLDAGTVASTSTGEIGVTISQALTGGTLYWLAMVSQSGSAEPTLLSTDLAQNFQLGSRAPMSNTFSTCLVGYTKTAVSGALPTLSSPTAQGAPDAVKIIQIKA